MSETDFASGAVPTHEVRCQEEDVLIGFLLYISKYPRSAAKKKLAGTPEGRNSIKYAADVVSTVRLWYESKRGASVGLRRTTGENSARFCTIRKALAKIQPAPLPPRQPVLVQHMRALHGVVDFDDHLDRTFWCLSLSCWLAICRLGDWLPTPAERQKGWRKKYRSHRGRLQLIPQEDGQDVLVVARKPPKEDPEARRYHESAFKTGLYAVVLNGGNAWQRMLEGDTLPEGTDLERVPIFRHQDTGEEVTKYEFQHWFSRKMALACLPQFGMKTHSIRVGGATTLNDLEGEAAARGVGGWLSASMLLYLHMSRSRRVHMGGVMENGPDLELRQDSRPIGRRR